jgi:large subunit ribosomal protein L35
VLANPLFCRYKPRLNRAVGSRVCLAAQTLKLPNEPNFVRRHLERPEMPKMKTKSGAKKRFWRSGSGKIKAGNAHKRHLLINKSKRGKRNAKGTMTLTRGDAKLVHTYMPYMRG